MIKASIAFKKAVADIGFKKAVATINFGDFLIFRFFADALGLSDTSAKSVGKSVTDSQAVTDIASVSTGKSESDAFSTSDSAELAIEKAHSDAGLLSDQIDSLDIEKVLAELSSVSESIDIQTAFNRSHTDAFTADESIRLNPGKVFSDTSAFTDSNTLSFFKGLSEGFGVADSATLNPNKILSDSFLAVEDQVMDFHKFITETAGVTDDLDGQATANDDQEMTFTKVRSDLTTLVDLFAYSSTRGISDTMGAFDSGSLRSQNYCAFDYFLEDYVGASQTF